MSDDQTCGNCGCEAICTWHCWNCEIDGRLGAGICDECKLMHDKGKLYKSHKIIRSSEMSNEKSTTPIERTGEMCEIHSHVPLKSFCEECSTAICELCEDVLHRRHADKLKPILNAVDSFIRDYSALKLELELMAVNIQSEMSTVVSIKEASMEHTVDLHSKIDDSWKDIIAICQEIRDKMHKEVDELSIVQFKKVEKHANILEQRLIIGEDCKNKMDKSLQYSTQNPIEFLRASVRLRPVVQSLVQRTGDTDALTDLLCMGRVEITKSITSQSLLKKLEELFKVETVPGAPKGVLTGSASAVTDTVTVPPAVIGGNKGIRDDQIHDLFDVDLLPGMASVAGAAGAGAAGDVSTCALLLLLDKENHRVHVCDAKTGAFLRMLGQQQLQCPITLAVLARCPRQDSLLFVTDQKSNDVKVFNIYTGSLLNCLGLVNEVSILRAPFGCCAQITPENVIELFVTDRNNNRVVVFDAMSGAVLRKISGQDDHTLNAPCCVAVSSPAASASELFVCDYINSRVLVFNARNGDYLRTIGQGNGDKAGELNRPVGIFVTLIATELGEDEQPTQTPLVFVTENSNNRIQIFDGRTGKSLGTLGSKGQAVGQLNCPHGIRVVRDADNASLFHIVVADCNNHRVQTLTWTCDL